MDMELPDAEKREEEEKRMRELSRIRRRDFIKEKLEEIKQSSDQKEEELFHGFFKPDPNLTKRDSVEKKRKSRALILSKINDAINKREFLKKQWKKLNQSPWARRKRDRIKMLMKLEKEIKEQKKIESTQKNELKKIIVGKEDPK